MTPDQERWAEALAVERMHGDRASAFASERVAALALADDKSGIARWIEIAAKLDALRLIGSRN